MKELLFIVLMMMSIMVGVWMLFYEPVMGRKRHAEEMARIKAEWERIYAARRARAAVMPLIIRSGDTCCCSGAVCTGDCRNHDS